MADITFDASAIDTSSRDPVPSGTYEAVIIESEIRATRSGNGKGLNLTFEIVSEEAKGRRVWAWINFQHPNADAQRIGQEELARICKAIGVTKLTDTQQLHNIPLMITVVLDKDDKTRNAISRYAAKAAAPGAPSAPTGTGAAPAAGGAPWAR